MGRRAKLKEFTELSNLGKNVHTLVRRHRGC